ncbi:uncharacterized protein [Callorhinus ursinus]|uniref:uncharacterized protein n=1 Tax=Callorhinus ursinus TaxID=34884 RepID=UPI003CD03EBB
MPGSSQPLCCALFSIWTGVCVFLAWLLRSLYILKETSSHKEEKNHVSLLIFNPLRSAPRWFSYLEFSASSAPITVGFGPVAQWITHLTTDQKIPGFSGPSPRPNNRQRCRNRQREAAEGSGPRGNHGSGEQTSRREKRLVGDEPFTQRQGRPGSRVYQGTRCETDGGRVREEAERMQPQEREKGLGSAAPSILAVLWPCRIMLPKLCLLKFGRG